MLFSVLRQAASFEYDSPRACYAIFILSKGEEYRSWFVGSFRHPDGIFSNFLLEKFMETFSVTVFCQN